MASDPFKGTRVVGDSLSNSNLRAALEQRGTSSQNLAKALAPGPAKAPAPAAPAPTKPKE
jgi:hypothetical protein